MKMFGTKLRTNINGNGCVADETIRRVTREKVVVRGNTTIRTMDSTTSFLPLIERFVHSGWFRIDSRNCSFFEFNFRIHYEFNGVSLSMKWTTAHINSSMNKHPLVSHRMLFSKQNISVKNVDCAIQWRFFTCSTSGMSLVLNRNRRGFNLLYCNEIYRTSDLVL